MKLYYEGKFPVDKLATVYPAEKMDEAIDDFKNGRVSRLSATILLLPKYH